MYEKNEKLTIEWEKETNTLKCTNPLADKNINTNKIAEMVDKILINEIPNIKNNSLLYNLVFYGVMEKMKTVQTVENVLSYMKENKIQKVKNVSIKNGEIRIKCSV